LPTIKSVERAVRGSARKHEHNKAIRSLVKTNITKAEKLIQTADAGSKEAVMLAQSTLDKAAKGVIHPKNAARRKSRLMLKLNKIAATVAAAPKVAAPAKKAAAKATAKKAEPKAKKPAAKAAKKA
jgi:small subunit ribosomal protein S20